MAESDFSTVDPGELVYLPASFFQQVLDSDLEPVAKTRIFAAGVRLNTLYMIARAGSGHIGSSFSSIDLVATIYLQVLKEGDIYFSSKGHDAPGLYSTLIALGRLPFKKIHELRRLHGLPGHPVVTTDGIEFNTGSLGMGISKAKGFVKAARLKGKNGNVFVMLGDGELQEGQIWESLIGAANEKMGEIVAIVDHNKFQSDLAVKSTSDLGDIEAKFRSFGWKCFRCNGNNLQELSDVFPLFSEERNVPKVLIADTTKGSGVPFMEHSSMTSGDVFYRYHSGAPTVQDYVSASEWLIREINLDWKRISEVELTLERVSPGSPQAPGATTKLIASYSDKLVELAERNPTVLALDADLILDTGLIPFKEKFPYRFFECGIAEQDMVSQAGALALQGFLPFVHSFACFLTTRPGEQIFNNASEGTKIIYVGSLAGLLPSGPGHSHQCVRDIALMSSIPNMVVIEPSSPKELSEILDWCIDECQQSVYIRIPSLPLKPSEAKDVRFSRVPGRGSVFGCGSRVVLVCYGGVLTPEAFDAANILQSEGISSKLLLTPWLNQFDIEWFVESVGSAELVVTVDNHNISGGVGERLRAALSGLLSKGTKFLCLGIDNLPACGRNEEVLKYHGLDSRSIADRVMGVLKRS